MFGNNPKRRREKGNLMLQVAEVFYTIQGEGPLTGTPAVFVRLTGCNLRCWFCDTEWDDENDLGRLPESLAIEVQSKAPSHKTLVVITGGEPCRQDLEQFFIDLNALGMYNIQIETAGSFWQDCLTRPGVTVVVSPKVSKVHPKFYEIDANWKYVIKAGQVSEEDGLPNADMQRDTTDPNLRVGGVPARPPEGAKVFLQPMDEYDMLRHNANVRAVKESSLKYGYRAGLQIHKLLGVE